MSNRKQPVLDAIDALVNEQLTQEASGAFGVDGGMVIIDEIGMAIIDEIQQLEDGTDDEA